LRQTCPLCGSRKFSSEKIILSDSKKETGINKCHGCELFYLQDMDKSRIDVYDENYSVWGEDEKGIVQLVEESKKTNFRKLLLKIRKQNGFKSFKGKSILDIATGNGYLLDVAKEMGFKDCYGLELSKSAAKIAAKKFPGNIFNCEASDLAKKTKKQFDVITLTDIVEHLPNIKKDFGAIQSRLKKGGLLIITTPNTDSITRKISPKKWYQYKFEHVIYFNKKSIKFLLSDLKIERLSNNTKSLKVAYYKAYAKKYVSPRLAKLVPDFLGKITITNPLLGELLAIARKK